jgi:hypothetical protein
MRSVAMSSRTAFTITINPKIPKLLERLEELLITFGMLGSCPHIICNDPYLWKWWDNPAFLR